MLISILPKLSITSFMGYLKGKSSLMIFDKHANLKYKNVINFNRSESHDRPRLIYFNLIQFEAYYTVEVIESFVVPFACL